MLIKKAWHQYLNLVVPKDASGTQISETRQAFYSGAALLFSLVLQAISEDAEPTAEDEVLMRSIQEEIDVFAQEMVEMAARKADPARTH